MKKKLSFCLSLFMMLSLYRVANPINDIDQAKIAAAGIGVLSGIVAAIQLSRHASEKKPVEDIDIKDNTENQETSECLANVLTSLSIGTINALLAYVIIWLGYISPNEKYHQAVTFSELMRGMYYIDPEGKTSDIDQKALERKKEVFDQYRHHFTDDMCQTFVRQWDRIHQA